ncbi:MAG TPA: choice-of-anchor L domain-containing protein, partial [Chitinophagaceae bacterium]
MRKLLPVILLLSAFPAISQINVTNETNPVILAQKIVGRGLTILNAQFKGGETSAGVFKKTGGNFLLDSGIVLTTGNAKTVPGKLGVNAPASSHLSVTHTPTSQGDADLAFQAGVASVNDACVLEFDFIPQGDSIYVRYIFGSEEYPDFNCSDFNDVFAFLITGPGILGKKNIALVPHPTMAIPVTINTVNNGVPAGPIINCQLPIGSGGPFPQYYID